MIDKLIDRKKEKANDFVVRPDERLEYEIV
jgi:hypothetical protein